MAKGFVDALRRNSKDVAKLEGAQADEFLRLLKNTQDVLRGRYASLGGQGDPLNAFRIRSMIGETESAIAALERKALGQYADGAETAANMAVDHIGEELDRLSVAFDAKPLDVAIDAQAVLADPAQALLANHFESSVKRYGLDVLNGVRQKLFIGMRTGDSLSTVANAVAGTQGPFGVVGKSNAERLVRTEISQAYGAANHKSQVEAAKQVPDLKKVWIHVSSFICTICIGLNGTERPLDGTWTIKQGKRTKEVSHAPAHPRCTCRTVTMKSSWRKGLQKLGYLGGKEGTAEL
jgi:hypothetical protein